MNTAQSTVTGLSRAARKVNGWRRSWIEIRLLYGRRSSLTWNKCTNLLEQYLNTGGSREDFYHYYAYREDLLDDEDGTNGIRREQKPRSFG